MTRILVIWALICLVVLAGCEEPLAAPGPVDTGTPAPSTASAASPAPSPAFTPTSGPPSLSLGAPVWLGRGRIVDASFTPDGRLLAVGWGNGVSFWSGETGGERWWQATNACVVAVDLHAQGRAVAAPLEDGSVTVCDAATGEARRYERAEPNAYWGDVAWSPDGKQIAFQLIGPGRGDPIYLLDPESGAVREVPGSEISSTTVPHLAWSPDGETITLASLGGGCATLVDVRTGQERLTLGSGDACYSPYELAWRPDGKAIAALSMNPAGRLELLDAQTGQLVRSMEGGVDGLPSAPSGRFLVFSPDGRLLASRGGQGPHPVGWIPLVVWDVATGEPVGRLQGHVEGEDRVAVAFDGDSLVSLYASGEITRWRPGAEESTAARLEVLAPEPPLAWSADGRRLAAAGLNGGVIVWDTTTGAPLLTFGPEFSVPAFSPDGRLLALTDREAHEEVIYDPAAGQVIQRLPGASPGPQGAGFSPDGRLIAYGSGNRVLVAEVASGRPVAELTGYPEAQSIARVIWSPDGSALVAASGTRYGEEAGLVILWEQNEDGSFRPVFHTQSVRASSPEKPVALFSPRGTLVAFEDLPRSEAGLMSTPVFDRTSGKVILTLKEYQLGNWVSDEVLLTAEAQYDCRLTRWNVRSGAKSVGEGRDTNANSYAPGGVHYATFSDPPHADRRIDVRDWQTGQVICSAYHGSSVFHISWSPDGRKIASLATNGTIVVWAVGEVPAETSSLPAAAPEPTPAAAPGASPATTRLSPPAIPVPAHVSAWTGEGWDKVY